MCQEVHRSAPRRNNKLVHDTFAYASFVGIKELVVVNVVLGILVLPKKRAQLNEK